MNGKFEKLVKELKEELIGKKMTIIDIDNVAMSMQEIGYSELDHVDIDTIVSNESVSYNLDGYDYVNIIFKVEDKDKEVFDFTELEVLVTDITIV